MTATHIDATVLTTYDVDPDGAHVRLHLRDRCGRPASLILPAACANQLLMSLPRMIQAALRNSHGDDSLRLVHPMEGYRIELGEPDVNGVQQFILTLMTGQGFEVSFAANADALADLARTIFLDALSFPVGLDEAPRHS